MRKALFVGLTTLDMVFGVDGVPHTNSKNVVRDWLLLAGGPAANAAVTCQALGGDATLLTVMGRHALSATVREDLEAQSVTIRDLAPDFAEPPAFASVLVSSDGDRLAVSSGALHLPQPEDVSILAELRPDVVLVDGHLMPLSIAAVREARRLRIPTVLDGGSWKDGCETLLPLIDAAICSEDFFPPGTESSEEALDRLSRWGVPYSAITRGGDPILYLTPSAAGEVPVEKIQAVDTLAAGDVFHGAFVQGWDLTEEGFPAGLAFAAKIATAKCREFGARSWIPKLRLADG